MNILMVCLGNICRSPMAHGILREKAKDLGWNVDSAGTSAYHAGDGPDPRSVQTARKNGVKITDLISRRFEVEDFDSFDIIYAMDRSNYNNILEMARDENDRAKVKMILNELNPGSNAEVPDPYYGGEHGFDHVYKLLDDVTNKIIEKYG